MSAVPIASSGNSLHFLFVLFLKYAAPVLGDVLVWLIPPSLSDYMDSSIYVTVNRGTYNVLCVISASIS